MSTTFVTAAPPFLIAEVAQGYEGSEKLVALFVQAAAAAGADAVKFQIFYADESAFPDYTHYALYKQLELPPAVWERAVADAHARGMAFYADAIGRASFAMLERIGVDGYKVHTSNIANTPLLHVVAAQSSRERHMLISTGGCLPDEVDAAVALFAGHPITIMHGFQAEPTDIADNNLRRITTLAERYRASIGFQDHTAGDSDLAPFTAFMAIGLGATVIEKHLTLSRRAGMEDWVSALTPEEFLDFSQKVKTAYAALGSQEWALTDREWAYRKKLQRTVCAYRDIAPGEVMCAEDLILKRTSKINTITAVADVIGKRARRAIASDTIIAAGDLV
ncbi:MAG: N-acetylneuraminate synthase family protein [bacterium]|nr:N-acetylneuraminate synthase family protein [bacterium]